MQGAARFLGDGMKHIFRALSMMIVALVLLPWQVNAQETTQTTQTTQTSQPLFSEAEIEQLVAPIALYPDPLLAQILMASTYPLEVVSAARWLEANPNLKDKALEDALQQQNWDASVKSLTIVPQVLNMLNQKLDMTQKLGDAFLAQQKDVMDAVQRLRNKAQVAGNLKSSKEQVINTAQDQGSSIITIEPVDPEVIYVPIYDPSLMYGEWDYPAYPPYDYYPYGYEGGTALFSFGVGLFVGNALWGNYNWRDGNININVNRYNSFNRAHINNAHWQHDVAHRRGVQYRDLASQQRYGKGQLQGNATRDAFRGRAEQGRQELSRGGVNTLNRNTTTSRQVQSTRNSSQTQNLSSQHHNRVNQSSNVTQSSRVTQSNSAIQSNHHNAVSGGQRRAGTFEGIHQGAQTRNFSSRGASSRASAVSRAVPSHAPAAVSRSAPSRSPAVSRGGAGGGRVGGGGGHGGGGGRHR